MWDLSLTSTCFGSCSLSLSSPRFEKLQPIIYLLWRVCVSEMFSCPGVTAFHAPTLSLIHVITLPSAKRKEWGEKEREAFFLFCLRVQAIVCLGRQHQSFPLHWLAAYTHWTNTPSCTHNSICLNSQVKIEKYCSFWFSLFLMQLEKSSRFGPVLIHWAAFSPSLYVRLFVADMHMHKQTGMHKHKISKYAYTHKVGLQWGSPRRASIISTLVKLICISLQRRSMQMGRI